MVQCLSVCLLLNLSLKQNSAWKLKISCAEARLWKSVRGKFKFIKAIQIISSSRASWIQDLVNLRYLWFKSQVCINAVTGQKLHATFCCVVPRVNKRLLDCSLSSSLSHSLRSFFWDHSKFMAIRPSIHSPAYSEQQLQPWFVKVSLQTPANIQLQSRDSALDRREYWIEHQQFWTIFMAIGNILNLSLESHFQDCESSQDSKNRAATYLPPPPASSPSQLQWINQRWTLLTCE